MPKTRVDLKFAARLAVSAAFAVALVGAAHADGPLFSQTVLDSLRSSQSTGGVSPVGGTTTLAPLTGSTSSTTSTGGYNGGFSNHAAPPSAVPEPITMGLAVAGLGIAFRRVRRAK